MTCQQFAIALKEYNDEVDEEEGGYIIVLIPGHSIVLGERNYGHYRLYKDYFAEEPVFCPTFFRRRFRMRRSLFLSIINKIQGFDKEFQVRKNACGQSGFTPYQKMAASLRMLRYEYSDDCIDGYLRMSESSTMYCFKRFCNNVVQCDKDDYRRRPNQQDFEKLMKENKESGFPGMTLVGLLTVHIGSGKIVPLHGMANTLVRKVLPVSC